jgi:RNA polymerase sigma-70 factor, ECF subfamily
MPNQTIDAPTASHANRLFAEIEAERAYLIRFALSKVRDADVAEEVVQEALLAALSGINSFQGDSSLRTWLTSILKFKIIDHQRSAATNRERYATAPAEQSEDGSSVDWLDQLFDETGHWRADMGTWAMPEAAHEQQAFFVALERCMDKLPKATARVFFQREVIGEDTDVICKEEGISSSNCWVMLHRARMGLRECLQKNWFGQ